MVGTKLTPRGYGIAKSGLSDVEYSMIVKELTVQPANGIGMGCPRSFACYKESSERLYVPKEYGLAKFGDPDTSTIGDGSEIQVDFQGTLRDVQKDAVDAYMRSTRQGLPGGGLLVLPCGFGKTVCALYLISALKQKTLIIVHKDFLLKQWKERILQYLPDARVGIIKASKYDVEHKDIVIASLQSLCMKEYTLSDFGVVIVDEVHHIAAEVFSKALHKINFMYSIGLSATPTRKDGLTKVIKWFMGKTVFKAAKRKDHLLVQPVTYKSDDPLYNTVHTMFDGKVNMSRMINSICDYEPRVEFVVDELERLLCKEPARNTILLSDRRNHLDRLALQIRKQLPDARVGFYVGGMKEPELQKTEDECNVILATYSMAAEGMDIPKLDTLILASPKGDVEQAVGRIQRKKPEDRQYVPVVIDVVDTFSVFHRQYQRRVKHYQKMGYEIEQPSVVKCDSNNYNKGELDMDVLRRSLLRR